MVFFKQNKQQIFGGYLIHKTTEMLIFGALKNCVKFVVSRVC